MTSLLISKSNDVQLMTLTLPAMGIGSNFVMCFVPIRTISGVVIPASRVVVLLCMYCSASWHLAKARHTCLSASMSLRK